MKRSVLMIVLLLCPSLVCLGQKLVKITITYATTTDDKEWKSQVRNSIVCSGKEIAVLDCCNQNEQTDHWTDHSKTTRDISNPQPLEKGSLHGCTFNFGMVPNGRDRWHVIPSMQAFYDDGTSDHWSWDELYLSNNKTRALHMK